MRIDEVRQQSMDLKHIVVDVQENKLDAHIYHTKFEHMIDKVDQL